MGVFQDSFAAKEVPWPQNARPYQARQGGGGPRPHRVPAPLHGYEEGGPEQALRAQEVRLGPDPKTGGYREGFLESGGDIANIGAEDADLSTKLVVAVGHEKFTHKQAEVGRVNPPKFEKCEDMVNLTFLNDASVFWNLKTRYQAKM